MANGVQGTVYLDEQGNPYIKSPAVFQPQNALPQTVQAPSSGPAQPPRTATTYLDDAGNPLPPEPEAPYRPPGFEGLKLQTSAESPQSRAIAQTQAENPPIPPYYGFTSGNIARNVWEGAKSLAGGVYGLGKDIVQNPNWVTGPGSTLEKFVVQPSEREVEKAGTELEAGRPVPAAGYALASAVPFVGPWAAGLGEQAGKGDIGGAAGQTAGTVAAGAAVPTAVRGTRAVARSVAPSLMESGIGIPKSAKLWGKTPGEAMLKESSGAGLGGTLQTSLERAGDIGQAIVAGYDSHANNPVSVKPAVQVIDKYLSQQNVRGVDMRPDMVKTLGAVRDTLTSLPDQLTPKELWRIKTLQGDLINWDSPDPATRALGKKIQREIYGALDKELDRVAPEVSNLNNRFASLKEGYDAAESTSRGPTFTQAVADRVARRTGGSAVALYELLSGNPFKAAAAVGLPELVSRPSARIGAARALWSLGGGEKLPAPTPPSAPPPFRPAGLLPPAPIFTPAPIDTSYVTGVPAAPPIYTGARMLTAGEGIGPLTPPVRPYEVFGSAPTGPEYRAYPFTPQPSPEPPFTRSSRQSRLPRKPPQ